MIGSEEWKKRRGQRVSGTDAGVILGFSKFRTPMDLWRQKMGIGAPFEMNQFVEWGNRLEQDVALKFHQSRGVWLTDGVYVEKDWRCGTPDRLIYGKREGLEIKTAGEKYAAQYKRGEISKDYEYQCRWYMSLLDYDRWFLAVLVGGNKYYDYCIERSMELECDMLTKCESFYVNNILGRIPPGEVK